MNENYNPQNPNPQGMAICPHCGAPVRSDATFCGNCGGALRSGFSHVRRDMDVMGVFDYILSMVLFSLPIVGLILMLYWGFSSTTGINRKNFARAYLVLYVIQLILVFACTALFGSAFASLTAYGF